MKPQLRVCSPANPQASLFALNRRNNIPERSRAWAGETDRETREFLVDVRIKELPRNWTIGQRAEVFIETARKEGAVVIPERFLLWRSGNAGLFINKQGRATWRGVTLGLKGRDIVEITQGLALGEQAVMPGEPKQPLSDGMRISIP